MCIKRFVYQVQRLLKYRLDCALPNFTRQRQACGKSTHPATSRLDILRFSHPLRRSYRSEIHPYCQACKASFRRFPLIAFLSMRIGHIFLTFSPPRRIYGQF
jgi:hypothetical protein